jgi:uncharacterized protein
VISVGAARVWLLLSGFFCDNAATSSQTAMHAFVYKSLRKDETYVYLREKDAFGLLPESVIKPLGELQFVLSIELNEGRQLARENIEVVRTNLRERGFHLQLPPSMIDPLLTVQDVD